MKFDFTPLQNELALWAAGGMQLPIWWRDDDATAKTSNLERLNSLSERTGIAVHIAVVPKFATCELSEYARTKSNMLVVAHGWTHNNHQPRPGIRSEFGNARKLARNFRDACAAHKKMTTMFGEKYRPMFVPPWGNIASDLLPHLQDAGFKFISTFGPRSQCEQHGLITWNGHLDPLLWSPKPSLNNADHLIARVCERLKNRRLGMEDNREPFGIVTHHLADSEDAWDFVAALFDTLLNGPAQCSWLPR